MPGGIVLLLWLGACAAPPTLVLGPALDAVQSGTSAFSRGSMRMVWHRPLDAAVAASVRTLNALDLAVRSDHAGVGYHHLEAFDRGGTRIVLRLEEHSQNLTGATLRVGVIGDEPFSKVILDHIERLLNIEGPPLPGR
jgi:hypothetical protein